MEKKQLNWSTIKCPHCGAEYHVSEIFYPEDFTGSPKRIIKDPLNKIIYVDADPDEETNLEEHYVCDVCGKGFVVTATVSFKVKPEDEELDFSSDSVSLL